MILKKHLETEKEYWIVIRYLEDYLRKTQRGLEKGKIEKTPEIEQQFKDSFGILGLLIPELSRFGVVAPPDYLKTRKVETAPAPQGKKWYWDWYEERERKPHEEAADIAILFALVGI